MDYLALDGLSAAVQELQSQTEVAKVLSCIVDAVVDAGGRALVDELRVELEHALGEARGAEAEAERLRDLRGAIAGGSDDGGTTRRGRSTGAAERQAQRQAESRAALATAVERGVLAKAAPFGECRLRSGQQCTAIRLRATDVSAGVFKAAWDAILDDLGRRNQDWVHIV